MWPCFALIFERRRLNPVRHTLRETRLCSAARPQCTEAEADRGRQRQRQAERDRQGMSTHAAAVGTQAHEVRCLNLADGTLSLLSLSLSAGVCVCVCLTLSLSVQIPSRQSGRWRRGSCCCSVSHHPAQKATAAQCSPICLPASACVRPARRRRHR